MTITVSLPQLQVEVHAPLVGRPAEGRERLWTRQRDRFVVEKMTQQVWLAKNPSQSNPNNYPIVLPAAERTAFHVTENHQIPRFGTHPIFVYMRANVITLHAEVWSPAVRRAMGTVICPPG